MSTYVDFHVLQTVPPSCVNRDDTGSPKTAVYGGVVRSRVSSQAWKHAMREMFTELFKDEELGARTKNVIEMVNAEGRKLNGGSDLDEKKIEAAMTSAGITFKDGKSDALFFMSAEQAKAVAEYVLNGSGKEESEKNKKDKKNKKDTLKKVLKDNPSVDIALFGRMVASDPTLNCDAASQVAHAISTHKVQNEFDYFTAVDDLQEKDNAGAGHLGTVEYNSSTLYRYANINVTELINTIGVGSVPDVVAKFAKAFICSMPTGKENTFANRTLPSMIYIAIRKDLPINLCGAFESPVKSKGEGYAAASEKAFVAYTDKLYKEYGAKPVCEFCLGGDISELGETYSLPEMLAALKDKIASVKE